MLNVLEHVPDPFDALATVWRMVRPGGIVAIVVPSIVPAYGYFRVTRALGLSGGVPTSAFDLPYHLTVFEPRTLRLLLERTGWLVRELRAAPVIVNSSRLKTMAKRTIRAASDMIQFVSGDRFVVGYSILAVASKSTRQTSAA
jgi:hypothetical protein